MNNINTKLYWNSRFKSGDWEIKQGREQTRLFALTQIDYLLIPEQFSGVILDFGCGLGDALPVYRKKYPKAKLIGMDISNEAIEKCKAKFGNIAEYQQGDHTNVPSVDIIISSNVFEHLTDDKYIAESLLKLTRELVIIVPYKEFIDNSNGEHVNSYDEYSFSNLGEYTFKIFPSFGWSEYGWNLWWHIRFKNIFRKILMQKTKQRKMQIMFHFYNKSSSINTE
jgi:SAM-dependent methyltransferase